MDFHTKNWTENGVHPDIIDLNVRSVSGPEAFERLYGKTAKRRNDGRLRDRYLRIYRRFENLDGWVVTGIDPLTWGDMDWLRFKVIKGQLIDPKKGKAQRYVSPAWGANSSRAIFLRVPDWVWDLVAERYGIEVTEEDRQLPGGFWQWVVLRKVPVIICEGEMKAGCLLSLGYAAISIPGIWNGRRNPKFPGGTVPLGRPFLIPELAVLDNPGQEVTFWFDTEERQDKAQTVLKAAIATGECFKNATVTICRHPGPAKGVDDFVMAGGNFDAVYNSRKPLSAVKAEQSWNLTYPVSQRFNRRYLGELHLPQSGIVGVKSAKNTGKTTALQSVVAENLAEGKRTLLLTHRIVLGEAICSAVGLPWVAETGTCAEGRLLGFGLCVDSLRPDGQGRIRPEEWAGATLILDEAEQVVNHLLSSSTCLKERVQILATFRQLVCTVLRTGGRIIAQDADLSDVSVEFLCRQCDFPVTPHIIVNEWKPGEESRWDVSYYSTSGNSTQDAPSALLARAVAEVNAGGRVFLSLDAQRAKSNWGSKNLERYFRRRCPGKRVLRIDAESVADPKHPAFGCAAHLNRIVGDYDAVICSPTIATGVSIDIKGHFTGVYGAFQGAIPANEILQSLARVREPVHRHVWVRRRAVGVIGDGSTSPGGVRRSVHRSASLNARLLEVADFNEDGESYDPIALRTWAKLAARTNAAGLQLRESVLCRLQEEGHAVTVVTDTEPDTADEVREEREAGWEEEARAVTDAPELSQAEYDRLQDKRSRTEEERLSEENYKLRQRYGVPVVPVLKKLNDSQWHSKIYLHYLLTVADPATVAQRDRHHLADHLERGGGKVHLPDLRLLSGSLWVLQLIGFERFLDPEREWRASDPEVRETVAWLVKYRRDIKNVLNLTISPELAEKSPIRVIQNVLARLGCRLVGKQQRIAGTGERERVYRFGGWRDRLEREEAPGLRAEVFAAWRQRDLAGVRCDAA